MKDDITIFLDYDDVLVDWCTPACETFSLDLNDPEVRSEIENRWGGIDKWVPDSILWEKINILGEKWWADLPVLPWAHKLWDELSKIGEVCILTAPNGDPTCAAGKVASIRKHFNTRNYLIGKPKYLAAGPSKILVDDRPENCEKFEEYGGNTFLWPNAVKLLRSGQCDKMVEKCVEFVKEVEMFIETNCPILPISCTPSLQIAEK